MTSSQEELGIPAKFRVIQEKDFDQVAAMTKTENVSMTRHTLVIMLREGQSDFYVLEDINDGKILGVASVSRTRPGEAILGNVVIREDYRSQGLGRFFVPNILRLYDNVTVTLLSFADNFYRSLGCTFSNTQLCCNVAVDFKRDKVKQYCQENVPEYSVTTIPFSGDRREDLIRYDTGCKGYENRKPISALIGYADCIIIAVAGKERRIVGYASACGDDNLIHLFKVYADDDKIAALLLRHLLIDSYPKHESAEMITLCSRRFLALFGDIVILTEHHLVSTGQTEPALIPESKVYALSLP